MRRRWTRRWPGAATAPPPRPSPPTASPGRRPCRGARRPPERRAPDHRSPDHRSLLAALLPTTRARRPTGAASGPASPQAHHAVAARRGGAVGSLDVADGAVEELFL